MSFFGQRIERLFGELSVLKLEAAPLHHFKKNSIPTLKKQLDEELSRASHRALAFAGDLLKKAPSQPSGYEVRHTPEGWMIFESNSMIPIQLFKLKSEASREARLLARAAGVQVTFHKRRSGEEN